MLSTKASLRRNILDEFDLKFRFCQFPAKLPFNENDYVTYGEEIA